MPTHMLILSAVDIAVCLEREDVVVSFDRPVWAEISLSSLRHNMRQIRSLLKPGVRFCPIIKADGYGHGAVPLAHEAVALGADYLGVAILDEAAALRAAGITVPILILGYTPPQAASFVVSNHITQTIFSKEQADALSAAAAGLGMSVKVHVKVDTGMTRIGVRPEDAAAFCSYVSSLGNLVLEGMFTHFASSDSADRSYCLKQFERFQAAMAAVEASGIRLAIRHCANSAAILSMPEAQLDMVRAGIILYGLKPSDECPIPIELRPAMRLKARLAMVKQVPPGVGVSYGSIFHTQKDSVLGTIPIGYADGYTRMLSKKAEVIVRNQRAPVVGRICMDQCMTDVSHIPDVRAGDEVLLFGSPELPADEIAAHLGTINYEIVCMVGKRVPRVYVE